MQESQERAEYTLVARKPSFGLPTGCPICLPLFIYLKFSNFPFHLVFNNTFPDSEWISMKAMVSTWLADAIMYELLVGFDGTSARTIYHSGLPWLIGKALLMKQVHVVKQRLGITKENAERREAEESLMLRSALLEHGNLIRYAEKLKTDFLEAGSSSSVLQFLSDASSPSTRRPSNSGSKPKKQPKRERTEEEKTFRRRARYFLVTQVVAVLVFQSVMSSNDFSEVDVDEDEDEGFSYD